MLKKKLNYYEPKRHLHRGLAGRPVYDFAGGKMRLSEGIIGEPMPALWKPKTFVFCPYCKTEIKPGYQNVVKHWTECPKNYKTGLSPLIDEIKRQIKF